MTDETDGFRGNQFEIYFAKFPHILSCFSGVYAINEIPKSIPIRHFIICKLSEKHLPGSHWTVIVRSSKNTIELFNSLGQQNLDIFKPYFRFQKKFEISFNKESVQSLTSKFCGYFCIMFIIFCILNFDMSMENVLEDIFYSKDLIKNDEIVSKFCHNVLTATNDDFF